MTSIPAKILDLLILPMEIVVDMGLVLLLAPALGFGQAAVSHYEIDPQVVIPGETGEIRVQYHTRGSPTRVTFERHLQRGVEMDLHDDGAGGDRVAKDGIYTLTLPVEPILAAMQDVDVYRPFLGFFRLYEGTLSYGFYNTFAEVADPRIPVSAVIQDAPDVQHTAYVVNIHMPEAFPSGDSGIPGFPGGSPSGLVLKSVITKRFYQLFSDDYDMLNLVFVPSYYQNRQHYGITNSVRGIGLDLVDNSSALSYGSSGKLQGVNMFPVTVLFDGASTGFSHEIGHQWIAFLDAPPVSTNRPHWPFSTMATGTMGYSSPGDQGTPFDCILSEQPDGIHLRPRAGQAMFNDLDLYLMGFLPPDQVSEQIVLETSDPGIRNLCRAYGVYTGPFQRLMLSNLISNPGIGPRIPSSADAQRHFRLATIVISRDGLLSREAMSFYSYFAGRMELRQQTLVREGHDQDIANPFYVATRGLGTLSGQISNEPALIVGPSRLKFISTTSGAMPPEQVLSITNSGPQRVTWTAATNEAWMRLSSTSGSTPAGTSLRVTPVGLTAGEYRGTVTVNSLGNPPRSVPVTLTIAGGAATPAMITGVFNAASFAPMITDATWVTILGSNLSHVTRQWTAEDFVGGQLPSALDGVSVTIDGRVAYPSYISPNQINVLSPDVPVGGQVPVQVMNRQGTSNTFFILKHPKGAPGLFVINGGNAAATHADGSLIAPYASIPGVPVTPAKEGETIVLYGTGFGPTDSPLLPGQVVTRPAQHTGEVIVRIGGVNANVVFAGVVAPGLTQINVVVPTIGEGFAEAQAYAGGLSSERVVIAIGR